VRDHRRAGWVLGGHRLQPGQEQPDLDEDRRRHDPGERAEQLAGVAEAVGQRRRPAVAGARAVHRGQGGAGRVQLPPGRVRVAAGERRRQLVLEGPLAWDRALEQQVQLGHPGQRLGQGRGVRARRPAAPHGRHGLVGVAALGPPVGLGDDHGRAGRAWRVGEVVAQHGPAARLVDEDVDGAGIDRRPSASATMARARSGSVSWGRTARAVSAGCGSRSSPSAGRWQCHPGPPNGTSSPAGRAGPVRPGGLRVPRSAVVPAGVVTW